MPSNLQGLSTQLGAKYGVDSALIDAVAQQESTYGAASRNVMQVNGMDNATPEASMDRGSSMLASYMKQTGGNVELSLAMYNMGQGIKSFIERNGIKDVRQGMKEFSSYMKKKHGYKVYGDPQYIDHVLRYYKQ